MLDEVKKNCVLFVVYSIRAMGEGRGVGEDLILILNSEESTLNPSVAITITRNFKKQTDKNSKYTP